MRFVSFPFTTLVSYQWVKEVGKDIFAVEWAQKERSCRKKETISLFNRKQIESFQSYTVSGKPLHREEIFEFWWKQVSLFLKDYFTQNVDACGHSNAKFELQMDDFEHGGKKTFILYFPSASRSNLPKQFSFFCLCWCCTIGKEGRQ